MKTFLSKIRFLLPLLILILSLLPSALHAGIHGKAKKHKGICCTQRLHNQHNPLASDEDLYSNVEDENEEEEDDDEQIALADSHKKFFAVYYIYHQDWTIAPARLMSYVFHPVPDGAVHRASFLSVVQMLRI